MIESAARWESPDDFARRRGLHPVNTDHLRIAEFRAKVRAAGEGWVGGGRPGELVELLAKAAAGDPELARLVRVGGQLVEDFLDGFRHNEAVRQDSVGVPPRDLVGDLIDGRPIAQDVLDGMAANYLVTVVRAPDQGAVALRDAAGPDALVTTREGVLVLLAPDIGDEHTERAVGQLSRWLAGSGWIATARRARAEIAAGFAEASEVLRLVVAGRRPSGVYSLADVLVEYAVTQHEEVAANLASVIKPLRSHPVLWETLTALIDADYNRNKAAKSLFIHRSTLDYRLQRVQQITGFDPTSGRGAQVLIAAMIVDATR
ncbi:PucR family transcriptional regulator [Saccharothrix sp. ALI-22-I]|uniref:PucR family transcriptional regulator n=1 Tax=Saccharothrix sp. ALI-22-I TaxID=1933778 RepID=UPI000A03D119|nr:PucR family transcriptional regulator [Saccharothrix sp. ALI-22-I]